MERRENPTIDFGTLVHWYIRLAISKSVNIGVERKERISIIKCAKKFATHLVNTLGIELKIIPRLRIGHHIHPHGVCAILLHHLKRIGHVTHMLTHLITFSIEHQACRDNILKCHTIKHHCSDGVQREKPATCLVYTFVNKVGGKCQPLVYQVGILKWIMHLCIRHCPRIEPHINEVGFAFHRFARLTHQHHIIYIRAMQIYFFVVFLRIVTGNKSFFF